MQKDRFHYFKDSQYIKDSLTGFLYTGNSKTCQLMNELNRRGDEFVELYFELLNDDGINPKEFLKFQRLMRKHEINSVEKLDRILIAQKVY